MSDHVTRILILEDSPDDAELVQRALAVASIAAEFLVVDDPAGLLEGLVDFRPDLVLADYALPGFTGAAAVGMVREWDDTVPCILVSGRLGEELAVTAFRSGATDYVLKQRLEVLPAAVRRALAEATDHAERQRLEGELVRIRDITADIFERMPIGLVALDPAFRVSYANSSAGSLLRRPGRPLEGLRANRLLPQGITERVRHARAKHPAETVTVEEPMGNEGWLEVMAFPTRDGTAMFLRDVTDRREMEETVRASQALMQGSLDAMLDPFLVCAAIRSDDGSLVDFAITLANAAAVRSFGGSRDSLTGRRMREMMVGTVADVMYSRSKRVVENREVWADDAFVIDPSPWTQGRRLVLALQVAPYRDGFFAVWRDVTLRDEARVERDRLAAVVQQAVDGIVITDPAGTVLHANEAFLASYDRRLEDLVGQPAVDLARSMLAQDKFDQLSRSVADGRSWSGEAQTNMGGIAKVVEISVTPSRDADGILTGFVVVSRDETQLRAAEDELRLQSRIRAALEESLRRIEPDATCEKAAETICHELTELQSVGQASVDLFLDDSRMLVVGESGPAGFPLRAGDYVPAQRAEVIKKRLEEGPWAWYAASDSSDPAWTTAMRAAGLEATAYGPILHRGEVIGALVVSTFDRGFAQTLVERMPGLVGFSAASSALLAERLEQRRREMHRRERIGEILTGQLFHPVYQPIIDLEDRDVVGYEALTRFDSGLKPDACFRDAWSVGLGPDLELATLGAAVAGSNQLPAGRWLDLNVSPSMLHSGHDLRSIVERAGRPVVIEITEHEAIGDYPAILDAVRALGPSVRLAVDDAGAGVANFGHIVELRPDFVKLDVGLVRGVHLDLGRQALVLAMRHFSRTTGCRLVAEGIETDQEAETLAELGVEYGQGDRFGRPFPAGELPRPKRNRGRDGGRRIGPAREPGDRASTGSGDFDAVVESEPVRA